MVIVKISDKRHNNGYRIKFFPTISITEEVVSFVRENAKAYWVQSYSELYTNREEFLKKYQ